MFLLSKVDSCLFYLVIGEGPMPSSKILHFSFLLHFHLLEDINELTHSFSPLSSLSLLLSVCLCLVHLRFLRSQDSEGDFILHWAMKALYKYIATASALIASAILIWLFCCASQHMEERERKKER